MQHQVYGDLDSMLSPEVLGAVVGQRITAVRVLPYDVASGSGNGFLVVETGEGQGQRYIVKRLSAERDWSMRATDDRRGREVVIWQQGLLDRLPPGVTHAVLAGAVDGAGWALLMRDVGASLLPVTPFSAEDNARFIDALAALQAAFWEEPALLDAGSALCDLWHFYSSLSPTTCRRESRGPDDFPAVVVRGWELLETGAEPDIAALLGQLIADPQPLCDALGRYPQTLTHRDINLGNLGVLRGPQPQVVLLDWQFCGAAPPAVELANYLSEFAGFLPLPREAVIAQYQQRLMEHLGARFDERWWRPQLELALLGNFLRSAWAYLFQITYDEAEERRALFRDEWTWWSEQARRGAA
jgi:hypothetical protein